jgi:hypothetical protein
LPNGQNIPTLGFKLISHPTIAFFVFPDLFFPKVEVGGRQSTPNAIMPVPKTSMNENSLALSRENQIRFAGQFFPVEPVAVSQAIDDLPNDQLRLGVLGTNRRHIERTLRRVDVIDHFIAIFLVPEVSVRPWPVENLHHTW